MDWREYEQLKEQGYGRTADLMWDNWLHAKRPSRLRRLLNRVLRPFKR